MGWIDLRLSSNPFESRAARRTRWLWVMRHFWNEPDFDEARFGLIIGKARYRQVSKMEREAWWAAGAEQDARTLLEGLPVQPAWRVLEIGCGVGRLLREFSPRVALTCGVDFSHQMAVFAGNYCAALPNVKVLQNNGSDLTMLRPETFDCCLSLTTFQHVDFPEIIQGYFQEIWRVLKPGGWFRFQLRWGPTPLRERVLRGLGYALASIFISEGKIRRMLEKSCFKIVSLEKEPGGRRWMWVTAVKPGRSYGR